jgi:predicted component of type VI protein secretion system
MSSQLTSSPPSEPFGELLSLCEACGNAQVHLLETVLGRAATCHVQIENPYVSGRHARVMLDPNDGSVSLEDLSSNGCFVNGKKVGRNKSGMSDWIS